MLKIKGKTTRKLLFILIFIFVISITIFYLIHKNEKNIKPPHYVGKVKKTKKKEQKSKPRFYKIAIIIDDVGYPVPTLKDYLTFNGKLTFSVLPYLSKSKEYAEKLHKRGFEIMIHIPMEPLKYPKINPGPGAIISTDSTSMVYKKISNMIKDNPCAVGANNHMGSKLTQDCQKINIVLKALKKHNLFFIDSLTTSKSCAYGEAKILKIPTIKRDVFLDNKNDYNYVKSQFLKLISIGRSRGYAIGIGHIQNIQTIKVIKSMLSNAERYRFHFVFASEVVTSK